MILGIVSHFEEQKKQTKKHHPSFFLLKWKQNSLVHLVQSLLLVNLAEQVRVELVHIEQLLAANIAPPGVGFTMATFMKEIEGLVRKENPAEQALEREVFLERRAPLTFRRRRWSRRRGGKRQPRPPLQIFPQESFQRRRFHEVA